MLVINKIDVTRLEDLTPDNRALVQDIIDTEGVQCVQVSCHSEEGVMNLKNKACDALLAQRVDAKLKGNKINTIINRIHVAQPKPRDEVVREPFIPEVVKLRKKYDKNDPDRRKLERDVELEEGGAGVYNINLKKNYHLANDEWKSDIIPEIMDGKNIADFVDPDIAEKLEALEREEEMLEAEGFYEDHEDMVDSDDEREAAAAKIALGHKMEAQRKKKIKNKARLPRTAGLRTLTDLTSDLTKAGIDPSRIQERAVMIAKVRAAGHKRKRDEDGMDVDVDGDGNGDDEDGDNWVSEGDGEDEMMMDVDGNGDEGEDGTQHKRGKANSGAAITHRKHAPRSNRQLAGMRDEAQISKATRLRNLGQRGRNMLAKAGESDRAIRVKMPKHLFSGKRKAGKTNRR